MPRFCPTRCPRFFFSNRKRFLVRDLPRFIPTQAPIVCPAVVNADSLHGPLFAQVFVWIQDAIASCIECRLLLWAKTAMGEAFWIAMFVFVTI